MPTRYLLFSVDAAVKNIPAGPFTTLELCPMAVAAAAAASRARQSRKWRRQKGGSASANHHNKGSRAAASNAAGRGPLGSRRGGGGSRICFRSVSAAESWLNGTCPERA